MIFSPRKQGKFNRRRAKALFLVLTLCFSFGLLIIRPAYAQVSVVSSVPDTINLVWDKLKDFLKTGLLKAGSSALQSVIRNSLNRLAYDAATYVGSGNVGQGKFYEDKEWGDVLGEVRDDAVGGFIEDMSKQFGANLCKPDLTTQLKIGLGLKAQTRPGKPDCSWQTLRNNWSVEIKKEDFLKTFASSFSPTSNDLGMSLTMNSRMMELIAEKERARQLELAAKNGWKEKTNIGGQVETPPDMAKVDLEIAKKNQAENVSKTTNDPFVDAANVFLNQLALTTFNTVMKKLTDSGKGGGPNESLLSADADPLSGGGAAGVRKSVSKVLTPTFNSRGDYNIIGELSICNPGLGGVGPTNCVINDLFRQAIEQKKTVGQAMKEGLLPKDASFGFKTSGGNEPTHLEGIPYRSMIILRKFRIIPVGWELAAQKINSDSSVAKNAYLGKMVECFSDNDSYEGYSAEWCRGLVDPDWVLKAPQNYCAKEGYGPQIVYSQSVDQGVDSITYQDKNRNGSFDPGEDKDVAGTSTTFTVKIPPKLLVNRSDTYCADEQSCIKEKNDGSCEYYGYCTEERRKWNFGTDSCEPVYNSCQSFKGEGGDSLSFLKNTLSFCSAENFGCERYAKASLDSYDMTSKKNDWIRNDGYAFFNKNALECEADNEGCHEFLRIRAGVGTNLIRNSGFELNESGDISDPTSGWIGSPVEPSGEHNYDAEPEKFWMLWGGSASIVDNAPGRGGKTLFFSATSPTDGQGLYSPDRSEGYAYSIMPQGFVMEPEVSYTLSADIYNVNADRVALMIGRQGQYWEQEEMTAKGSWGRISVTIKNNPQILANEIRIFGYGSGNIQFYIDNIKFEVGNQATPYSEYRQNNLVYQKILPTYLEGVCYVNPALGDYRFKPDAPPECRNFTRKCNRDEANCEMFSSKSGAKIPAAVTDKDYCLAECNGFDAYIQSQNKFNSRRSFYFIPKTAKQCSVAQAGCEEFTNLDKSAQGGESKEYYNYLRQCIKPNSPGNTCATFYTWEGNNEQGEQLSSHVLKAADNGDVALTSDDDSECSEAIFNYTASDPRYNPDCRKIYNQAGAVSYHLYARTISCTDDCHPYRMTNKNIDEWASNFPDICTYYEDVGVGHWDSASDSCYYCENGGYWSAEHNACIYNATPAESTACPAVANGCAEFNGNQGNDVRQIFLSTFEAGADSWTSGSNIRSGVVSGKQAWEISSGSTARELGSLIKRGSSYTLSFMAKPAGSGSVSLNASLEGDNGSDFFSTDAERTYTIEAKPNEWGIYQLNLASLEHEVSANERLVIYANGLVSVDNIKLSVISERYYLIRESWSTPASCNQDEKGKPYPLYMLGCSEYKDRLNNTHYLHKFSRICQESAVGCEAMIDTQNSTRQTSEYFGIGGGTLVPADRVAYAVYDPDKKCKSGFKGCELFGQARDYENSYIFEDSYRQNNPDKYGSILCEAAGVGCDKWSSADGDYYFKDPGDMVCEYRQGNVDGRVVWNWFKKKVKRCDGTGDICSSDANCLNKRCNGTGAVCTMDINCSSGQICKPDNSGGQKCKLDERNVVCPTSNLKTFGQGGIGNEIYQPVEEAGFNWVGLCSADQSGCTEYIDPVSDFSSNLVYNADFRQNQNNDAYGDGWNVYDSNLNHGVQKVFLEGNNVYILTVEGVNTITLDATNPRSTDFRPFYKLGESGSENILSEPSTSFLTVSGSSSAVFYVKNNADVNVTVINRLVDSNNSKIILRKAATDYQLAQGVDKNSCAGVANIKEGCVYFNERSIQGADGVKPLSKNAWREYGQAIGGPSNANYLIKVVPDRVCNQWLSCKTYIKGDDNKPVCFDIADCNRLDQGGNCANFTVLQGNQKNNRTYNSSVIGMENPETIKNLSGYVKVGYGQGGANKFTLLPNNLLDIGEMEQVGNNIKVSNGNFELYNKTLNSRNDGYNYTPASWSPYRSDSTPDDPSGMFDIIQDPASAQQTGVAYPAEGRAFLRYNPANADAAPFSDAIRVTPNEEYYLSYKIDTTDLIGDVDSQATVQIIPRGGNPTHTFSTPSSQSWKVEMHKFVSSVALINLRLSATTGSGGYVYIDDIKISPVLKIQKDVPDTYISQSCRLYPKEDSLSCDYYDEAGMRLKGEYGYCLEYDRDIGNPNACLLWWPIDKVSGQGAGKTVKAATAYAGPRPLFYCIGANMNRPYIDARQAYYAVDETMKITVNGVDVTETVGYDDNSSTQIQGPTFSCDATNMPAVDTDCYDVLDSKCTNNPFGCLGSNQSNYDTVPERIAAYREDGFMLFGFPVLYSCTQQGSTNIFSCFKWERSGSSAQSGDLFSRNALKVGVPNVDRDLGRIYLKYGVNNITFTLDANNSAGVTYGLFGGIFYYWDNAGVMRTGVFNMTNQGTPKTAEVSESTLPQIGNIPSRVENCRLRLGLSPNIDIPSFFGGNKAGTGYRNYFVVDGDNDRVCGDGRGIGGRTATFTITVPEFGCKNVVQVVDRNGANKIWAERFKASSGYTAPCNTNSLVGLPPGIVAEKGYSYAEAADAGATYDGTCAYSADANPFGSILSPEGSEFERSQPSAWQPTALPYRGTDTRMGQLYSPAALSYLFAESYGVWDWSTVSGRYEINNSSALTWTSPADICPNNARTGIFGSCSVRPDISNIELNGGNNATVFGSGFVNLTFNSKVDNQQAPLTLYEIDWGDLEKLSVSGQDMDDMPNRDTPHSAFHSYDYWDLRGKFDLATNKVKMPTVVCGDIDGTHPKPYCSVKPKVKIKDNWGWCSEGRNGEGNACPTPATAVCVNSSIPPTASSVKANCRDYMNLISALNMCPASTPYCSDGYYESQGEVTVYEY